MLKKLKAHLESKDAATRRPMAVRVAAPGMMTTGGTDWSKGCGISLGPDSPFLHLNTHQFMEHLGPGED